MKTTLFPGLRLGTVLVTAAASFAAAQTPVMRDAATHDELEKTLQVSRNSSPIAVQKPAPGPDPSTVNVSDSLASQSDFLSFAGRATLVPKQAILHVPANMADRVKFQPGSRVQTWAEFYAMNRGWITTVEVTRLQASGNQPLAEELKERIAKSSHLVVATYQTGPISVLPLKTAPSAEGSPSPATGAPATPASGTAANPTAPAAGTPATPVAKQP